MMVDYVREMTVKKSVSMVSMNHLSICSSFLYVYICYCFQTRMQTLVPDPKADYRSLYDAAQNIIRYEGMRNTMRGFSAMATGAGPAHALYFACYEEVKKMLSGGKQGNHLANGMYCIF